jgi:AraC-like DNA-binding protein
MTINDRFTFDQFNEKLWSLLHGQVLIPHFSSPLNIPNFIFQCVERDNVTFYLFESPDPMVLFSFHLPLSPQSKTLALLDVNTTGLRFNGIRCEENQFALISEKSQLPFTFQIPAHSPILVCDLKSDNNKFNQLCHSMVPVDCDLRYAQELKEIAKKVTKILPNHTSDVGAVLLKRIVELLSFHPTPMRPEASAGRSRLSRKDFIPKCIDFMMEMSSTEAIKRLSEQQQISEKTIRNSFKYITGFTPKEFEQISKLFAFRRALKQPDITTVLDAAIASDVYRWSRYASRYAKIFKELPRQTL